ncbi:MAG: hypothetical protein K9L26_03650 [Candidatus Izimaplasma sp.]|nr:hypothetical protein [Candidatus Izimaplasma bacterium]
MQCPKCKKILNDVSVICDDCGTQLQALETEISFNDVVDKIVLNSNPSAYSEGLQKALSEGLYLSKKLETVKWPFKYYIRTTLQFILFWAYYETHKKYLLTKEFTTDHALTVFETLNKEVISHEMDDILDAYYKDDYASLQMPKILFKGIKHPYLLDYKYPAYQSFNILIAYLSLGLKHILSYAVLFVAIVFGIYAINDILPITIPYIEMITSNAPYLVVIGIVGGCVGLILKRKTFQRLPIRRFVMQHKALRSHIDKHVKDKIKGLKAREEKE